MHRGHQPESCTIHLDVSDSLILANTGPCKLKKSPLKSLRQP
jgi:hypothetical protein